MEEQEIWEVLKAYPFWEKLTDKEKEQLARLLRKNTYRAGQMVSSSGSDCLGLFLIRKGDAAGVPDLGGRQGGHGVPAP